MTCIFILINIMVSVITLDNTNNYIFYERKIQIYKNNDTTMFKYNYQILSSIIKKNPFDTSIVCVKAVKYMEKFTGIKAHSDGNYFGWYLFTKQDLETWNNYYKKQSNPALRNLQFR